jgi:hypothetical protein
MRHLKQLCAVCVLTLALALSAFAGEMQAGVTGPQPSGTSSTTTQGEMQAGYTGDMSTTSSVTCTNLATGIALSLVQSVLALV